ncbi:MAG TPA: outer membrane protein [Pseudolabrys sp.]|nr:outer membrane protein [Pseudolabrys sp.]
MKRFTLAAYAALLAVVTAAPVVAADLPLPFKAAPTAAFNWTGFYAGVNGGYGWGKSNWTVSGTGATTGDFDTTGAMVGGTVGYNLQMSQFVVGFEGDIDAIWMKGTDATACCQTANDWFATARARLGYAMDRWMPFVTGGAAFGDVKMTTAAGSETATRIGWTAGAGLEYAFMGAWSAKIEYLYADLGNAACSVATCGAATDVSFKANIVRGGIDYHF